MYPVRHNVDERLRELQRAARAGDAGAAERLYRKAAQLGDCELVGETLFDMGPELAGKFLTPPKLPKAQHAQRDNHAICLGLALVAHGYLPDIPIRAYNPYSRFTERVVVTDPVWVNLPASVPGRARRRRFVSRRSFSYLNAWGNPEGVDGQTPTFYFKLEPLGKHYQASQYVSGLGMYEATRRIAPRLRWLARWNGSTVLTRRWGGGVRLDVAGGPVYWVANNTFAWAQSDPTRERSRYATSTPDERWKHFLSGSRAGVIPGEDVPPRPPDPYWTVAQVEAWLRDPKRNDLIRALFYADLWLAGLLVPGEEVAYDPITGGPKGASANPWRRNPDEDLRRLERSTAGDRRAEFRLRHARWRAGLPQLDDTALSWLIENHTEGDLHMDRTAGGGYTPTPDVLANRWSHETRKRMDAVGTELFGDQYWSEWGPSRYYGDHWGRTISVGHRSAWGQQRHDALSELQAAARSLGLDSTYFPPRSPLYVMVSNKKLLEAKAAWSDYVAWLRSLGGAREILASERA